MLSYGPPVYIPHLRHVVSPWRDIEDYPFVPLCEERDETQREHDLRKLVLEHVMRWGHEFWLTIPMFGDPAYEEYFEDSHLHWMRDMALTGHWRLSWDTQNSRDGGGFRLLPPKRTYRLSDFPVGAKLAHVMHRAKFFESVADARRNGWDKPIEPGLYICTADRYPVEITSDSPPVRLLNNTMVTLHFDEGPELHYNLGDDPDPIADWAVWARHWDGEHYQKQWVNFTQTRYSDALASCPTFIHVIRREPGWKSPGPGKLVTQHDARNVVEVVMPSIKGSQHGWDDYWRIANQVERSNASIQDRPVRQIKGLHIRRT
jgi:hypothetical protein